MHPALRCEPSGGGQCGPVESSADRAGARPVPMASVAAIRRAVVGRTETVLDTRTPLILDELSTVSARGSPTRPSFVNADANALMAGANLALVGDELLQFGRAEQLGPGRFRLSRLLRGRRGTEWAARTQPSASHFA